MTDRARTLRHVAAAFGVGLGLRLLVGQLLPVEPSWDGVIYERAAEMLAHDQGYTLRMYDPGWRWALPTAFYPPGWPAVLSILKAAELPLRIDLLLQALLGALSVLGAAFLGARARGHAGARFAGWAVALWPGGVLASASWMGEPLFTLGLCLALAPLVAPRVRWRGYALSALIFGALAYVRPTALAIAPCAFAARAWVDARGDRRRRILRAAAVPTMSAVALLPVAPWMARNQDRLGAAVISSNAGANLYVGTLGARFERIPDRLDCAAGIRELARDRCRRERALDRVEADPVGWLGLGVLKLAHTFGYEASPALQVAAGLGVSAPRSRPAVWALGALCTGYWLALLAFALARGRRARPSARAVVIGAALALAATHFVFLGGDRYHLPLVPLVAALGALSSPGGSRRGLRP